MSAPVVDDLELPVFDYTEPGLTGEVYHQRLAAVRQQGWLARSPLSYVVLDRESGEFFLRARQTAFPGREIADLFGVTGGRLREMIDANILNLTGDRHRRLRALVWPAFTPRAADRWRPAMRGFLAGLWQDLGGAADCEFVAAFAKPYPSLTIAAVLGAPAADAAQLHEWSSWVQRQFDIRALASEPDRIERAAVQELYDYVEALLEKRRSEPSDDLISTLLAAEAEGDRLTHTECVNLVLDVVAGGVDTTQAQLSHALRLFASHPEQWAALARDPGLVPAALHRGAPVRADHPVHRADLPGADRAPRGYLPGRLDRGHLRRAGQPRPGRAAMSSTSAGTRPTGCSRSARARTSASAPTWPGPSWRRRSRSCPPGCPACTRPARSSSATSRASTASTPSRWPGPPPNSTAFAGTAIIVMRENRARHYPGVSYRGGMGDQPWSGSARS